MLFSNYEYSIFSPAAVGLSVHNITQKSYEQIWKEFSGELRIAMTQGTIMGASRITVRIQKCSEEWG